jgi:hypothetical protein
VAGPLKNFYFTVLIQKKGDYILSSFIMFAIVAGILALAVAAF